MKITRLSGITSNILLNNTLQTVTLEGSSASAGSYAKGYVNDNIISTINSSTGLFVIVWDENLVHKDTKRFILTPNASSGKKDVDFVNYMGTISPRRYYAIVSNYQLKRSPVVDSFFSDYLGSNVWNTIWSQYSVPYDNYQDTADISYSAFGNTELGITHESSSLVSTADLCVSLRNYDNFCCSGYGIEQLSILDKNYGSSYTTIGTIVTNGSYKAIKISARYRNASNNSIRITKNYNGGGSSTVMAETTQGSLYKTLDTNIELGSSVSSVDIECRNIQVKHASVYKANTEPTVKPHSSVSRKGHGFSVKNATYSMNGFDLENPSHLANFAQNSNMFGTLNTSETVDGIQMNSVVVNGTTYSDMVDVNSKKDFFMGFFCKNASVSPSTVNVSVETFDDSQNMIQSFSLVAQSSTDIVELGDFTHPDSDVLYQEYYILSSKQSLNNISNAQYLLSGVYGNFDEGGLSANINNVNDICVMVPQVKYIRMKLEVSNPVEIISPLCDEIKFSITNYSTYLGNITES